MNCIKCGTVNTEGSRFCIKCGNDLQNQQMVQNQTMMQNNTILNQQTMNAQTNTMNYQQPVNNVNTTSPMQTSNTMMNNAPLNLVAFIIGALLKPIRCFKEEGSKLNNPKASLLLGVIMTIAATLFSLLNKVMSLVVEKNYLTDKTTWEWSNLEHFEWFKVIGKDFLFFGGIIFGVALLFYLASLVIKKDTNYMKLVAIVSISLLPAFLCHLILGPLLGQLWDKFALVIPLLGNVYMFVLLYELINEEVKLEKDAKVYFNLICFAIMVIALYFINIKYSVSAISSEYDELLDLFS